MLTSGVTTKKDSSLYEISEAQLDPVVDAFCSSLGKTAVARKKSHDRHHVHETTVTEAMSMTKLGVMHNFSPWVFRVFMMTINNKTLKNHITSLSPP